MKNEKAARAHCSCGELLLIELRRKGKGGVKYFLEGFQRVIFFFVFIFKGIGPSPFIYLFSS